MKKLILIFFITVNVLITLAAKEPVYSYEKNKSVIFLGGCAKGWLPNDSIEFYKIKDLTLKYKLEEAFKNDIEPTHFIFLLDGKEVILNTVDSDMVNKMCHHDKSQRVDINYYKIEGLKKDYFYLDEVFE
jgi:hypothetical protein